jgi:DNA-binding XRE family transcriptional regulator
LQQAVPCTGIEDFVTGHAFPRHIGVVVQTLRQLTQERSVRLSKGVVLKRMRCKDRQHAGHVSEWEAVIGEQVRAARIADNLDQEHLAALADISVGALSNLERGKGSSLKTLVAVVRTLGRTDWLEALAPPVSISPMQMLRARQKTPRARVRVRTSDTPARRKR